MSDHAPGSHAHADVSVAHVPVDGACCKGGSCKSCGSMGSFIPGLIIGLVAGGLGGAFIAPMLTESAEKPKQGVTIPQNRPAVRDESRPAPEGTPPTGTTGTVVPAPEAKPATEVKPAAPK